MQRVGRPGGSHEGVGRKKEDPKGPEEDPKGPDHCQWGPEGAREGPDHYVLKTRRTREGPGHCKSNRQSKLLWNFVSHICICSLSGLSTAKLRPISSLQNSSYFGRVHLGLPVIHTQNQFGCFPPLINGPTSTLLGLITVNTVKSSSNMYLRPTFACPCCFHSASARFHRGRTEKSISQSHGKQLLTPSFGK